MIEKMLKSYRLQKHVLTLTHGFSFLIFGKMSEPGIQPCNMSEHDSVFQQRITLWGLTGFFQIN